MVKKEKIKKKKITSKKKWFDLIFYTVSAIIIVILLFIGLRQRGLLPLWIDNQPSAQVGRLTEEVRARRQNFNIINAHEHVQNEECLPLLRKAMGDCQVQKMVMLGTPDFTFFLKTEYGFTGYEKNNDFIVKLSQDYPNEFAALVTLDPLDDHKTEKLRRYKEEGIAGVKLYNGHGTFYDLFFKMSLIDAGMMEIYAFCEQEQLPILYHINAGRFLTDFEHILQEFPNLIIIAPHFMMSTSNLNRLNRFMREYPQLYLDISFGHPDFLVAGFDRISNFHKDFRDFVIKYRDRITYGTDLVVTTYLAKSRAYIDDVQLAYMDLLEKEEFKLPPSIYNMMSRGAAKNIDINWIYHGLNLDEETLKMIYHDNAEKLFFKG